MSDTFSVLLPLKSPGTGKSRLAIEPADLREDLVIAFARDVVTALRRASRVAGVWVVGESALSPKVPHLPDEGGGDLNLALTRAAASVPGPVAVLLPDVPAVRPDEIDQVLDAAATRGGRHFVADHAGSGTTLLAAVDLDLSPAFGAGSAARHAAGGAVPVRGALPGLRHDVDTRLDLEAVFALGVGRNTAAALPSWGAPPQQ